MKRLTRVICVMVFCLMAMMGMSIVSNAATVGQVLSAPEEGWKRVDDTNEYIEYVGNNWVISNFEEYFNQTAHTTYPNSSENNTISFKFRGSKLRIISSYATMYSGNIKITIDGEIYNYSQKGTSLRGTINFEKLDLEYGLHNVIITGNSDGPLSIDAFDIDANGDFVPENTTDSDYEGNSAILEITMTNGTIKEYSLTNTELEAFLTWYDNRSDGIGKSYYLIPKKSNVEPFLSRKEYLSFDKIYSFEVKDYNK